MINSKQRAFLRKQAHHLRPLLNIGKGGLDENSIRAIDELLVAHELIKVKVLRNNLDDRKSLLEGLIEALGADLVQYMGNVLTIYRANEDAKIRLP